MRPMTDDELTMFQILKRDKECRNNNYQAVRTFYKMQYGVDLPALKGLPTIWTIERLIRTLKSEYPSELTDSEERQIKNSQEDLYKERALDANKPIKQRVEEQGTLGLFGEPSWWD